MYSTEKFHGIFPPVSTILKENGELDKSGMATLIDSLINAGVNGLFFLGSGGEFSQMFLEERKEVATFVTEYVGGRVPVWIGTGSSNTREVVLLSQHAEKIGADAVVIINPYYWPLTEENLMKHYGTVAESVNIPIILYNFPGLTGQDLSPRFILKLVEKYENIVGIKETVDSISHIRDVILTIKRKHPNFVVFCGFDDHLLPTLNLGGDGAINASVNFAPDISIQLYKAFREQRFDEALEFHKKLVFLPTMYSLDSPFINVVKEAAKLTGLNISTHVLPPSNPLSKDKLNDLKEILINAGVMKKVNK